MIVDWLNLRGAMAAAGVIGRSVHRVHPFKPSPGDVAEVFGGASQAGPADIARDMSALRYQNQVLVAMARRRGTRILQRFVDPATLDGLRPFLSGDPAIFLTWHLGPPFGLKGAFAQLGLQPLEIRRTVPAEKRSGLDPAAVDRGPDGRAAAMARAVGHLRNRGLVIIAGDGRDTSETVAACCLGRTASMPRGPFALARLTGAPLVPLLARWDDDGCVRVTVGEHLQGAGTGTAFETSQAAAAGRWLEAYLVASPKQLRRCSLQWLLDSPRCGTERNPADS